MVKFRLAWLAAAVFLYNGFQASEVRAAPDDPYRQLNVSWDRMGAVYSRILDNYYSEMDHAEIMTAAINGMLSELDSYSQYFDEEGMRQLRQDTTGKFAGLGITVGIKDQYPVVISPIEDTPAYRAGLQPGDLIVGIEGQATRGMTLEEVVNILRGEPGTEVNIHVKRQGVAQSWDLRLERQIIKIESVALVEQIVPGVGYVSLRQTRFSEDTAKDVEAALDVLLGKGVKGIILDLRGNPGGLLSQASQVADLFLPKDLPIVQIKEREGRRKETRVSQREPVVKDMPVVVLIDRGSASASEIVAGALQDNDRGVVIGRNSFGKGSVQTIFDLLAVEDTALKLTTALYYTPSGRSIHREDRSLNSPFVELPIGQLELPATPLLEILLRAEDRQQAEDELEARFDLDRSQAEGLLGTSLGDLIGRGPKRLSESRADSVRKQVYRTKSGRQVYGGGGIEPDIVIEPEPQPSIVQDLERQRVFFDFAVDFVAADSGRAQVSKVPEVDAQVIAAFREFINRGGKTDHLDRDTLDKIEALRRQGEQLNWDEVTQNALTTLEERIKDELSQVKVIEGAQAQIRAAIKRELVHRIKGKRASLLTALEEDRQVQEAIDLLLDSSRYRRILEDGAS